MMAFLNDHLKNKQKVALHVSGATKSFGKVDVLKGIDLKILAGERVALMGPSGSGKSTLLNCVCGIELLDGGTIHVGGQELSGLKRGELEKVRRENMGYVFQSFHLLPTLNAFENVEFAAQLVGMPKEQRIEKVTELFEQVGLSHRMDHLPNALSGGERQRVAIARALVHQPRLVLADEPTGSLDTESGNQVLTLLKTLSADLQVALLLVTHDHDSTRICDRVITMKDGTLLAS
ncbi:MAG: ABC transporter ATP-binding protein [Opitutales bacterium]|nr:ABC transporter ATP-binding protein [Opitutales bacterium]